MIDFPKKISRKKRTPSPSAYGSLLLSVGLNLSMSFASYRPAKQLREFIMGDRESELEHSAFEEHMPDTPLRFGEATDQIIIDWLNKEISPDIAAVKIGKVISEFDDFAYGQEKNMDGGKIDDLFRQMAVALRDQIFVGDAQRFKAWNAIREFRTFHNVSDEKREK